LQGIAIVAALLALSAFELAAHRKSRVEGCGNCTLGIFADGPRRIELGEV
jgi:hypothetical protein